MKNKVFLILIDGMRPDALQRIDQRLVHEFLLKKSSYSLCAKTTFPPVTLPCHMSLFHSVPPERHGITSNTYVPPARPVEGLFEVIAKNGGKSAMFYGWEPLRDISRPGSLTQARFIECYSAEHTDRLLAEEAMKCVIDNAPDFVFLYLVETDDKGGHDHGWMTPEYLDYVLRAVNEAAKLWEDFGEDYTFILTADHGGHGRGHGADCPEDMTIPVFFLGKEFEKGKDLGQISILDIAPTVCSVMGLTPPPQWEGKSVLSKDGNGK